jgi:alpha-L-arabinofuranosidase
MGHVQCVSIYAIGMMAAIGGDTDQPAITVDVTAPKRVLSSEMYGIFFEEISHAGNGGLYTELVQNRDVEASTIPPD